MNSSRFLSLTLVVALNGDRASQADATALPESMGILGATDRSGDA